MILRTLALENFCQHRNVLVEFSPQLNMLVGPNGCGKTNFLRGLQLALTGDAGGEQNKLENIRQSAAHYEQSGVLAELEHVGVQYTIQRKLRPNSTTLRFNGTCINGATAVNTELWSRLGITKKQLDDYVFVKQQQIAALIDKSPTARTDELAALFGIDKAKKIWRELGEAINDIHVMDMAPAIDLAAEELRGLRERCTSLATVLQTYQAVPDDAEAYYAQRRAIVAAWDQKQASQSELARLSVAIAEQDAVMAAARTSMAAKQADQQALEAAITTTTPEAKQAQATITAWAVFDANQSARAAYTAAAAALQLQHRNRPRAVKPADAEVVAAANDDELAQALTRNQEAARAERGSLSKTVEMLAGKTSDKCYACGQPLPNFEQAQEHLRTSQRQLELVTASVVQLDAQVAATVAYKRARSTQAQYRQLARDRIVQLRTQRDAIGEATQPQSSREAAQAIIDDLAAYEKARAAIAGELAAEQAKLTGASGRRAAIAEQLERAHTAAAAVAHATFEAAAVASNEILEMQAAVRNKQAVSLEHAAAHASQQAGERRLQAAEAAAAAAAADARARVRLEQVREVFHSAEAPKLVSHTYMRLMEQQINDTLCLFDSPFYIATDDELGFQATFLDGSGIVPDRWLSVGQRITLAMAFRIAVNSAFTRSLGMLILDEPTAGLDEHNMSCLPVALARLRAVSQAHGLQVLFVTHHAAHIGQYFDTVIDLGANGTITNS
jgi:DNA repair exonuclease SbcCD ATPase subunit